MRGTWIATVVVTALAVGAAPAAAATDRWKRPHDSWGTTARVSVSSLGNPASGDSVAPDLSADGRFVAFESAADNLVPRDTNGVADVFVRDLTRVTTTRISVASGGAQASGASRRPALSGDGRYVVFESAATNLVSGDTNGQVDVFVHDRHTGRTARVSVSSAGAQANGPSDWPSISAGGRIVSFHSGAGNLVARDSNGRNDAFVHDRRTGKTTRVSVSSAGGQADGHSFYTSLSADGRYVAFDSGAGNLVAHDTNGEFDAFVHDRRNGTTSRVSLATGGTPADSGGGWPSLSDNGRHVAFVSDATNLVPGDTNLDVNGRPAWDVFVHDRRTGRTTRVSVSSGGAQANSRSTSGAISPDGRHVAFQSVASNLVPGDTTPPHPTFGYPDNDVFVHDRRTGKTTRVNVSSHGDQADAHTLPFSYFPSISAHGTRVAFSSRASNLVRPDSNGALDIFVRTTGR